MSPSASDSSRVDTNRAGIGQHEVLEHARSAAGRHFNAHLLGSLKLEGKVAGGASVRLQLYRQVASPLGRIGDNERVAPLKHPILESAALGACRDVAGNSGKRGAPLSCVCHRRYEKCRHRTSNQYRPHFSPPFQCRPRLPTWIALSDQNHARHHHSPNSGAYMASGCDRLALLRVCWRQSPSAADSNP